MNTTFNLFEGWICRHRWVATHEAPVICPVCNYDYNLDHKVSWEPIAVQVEETS
jgi:hypothetical protein